MTDTRFIEKFEENVRLYPDKVILRDQETSLTFSELDELSGRVYAYLKAKGIGKEDFVMISLPRGVEPIVVMVGVWKAGAVAVNVSEQMPEARRNYIYNDCSCCIEINVGIYNEILSCEPKLGFELTDEHDAAFVVYTSGSEGNPKGFIHEYGKLMLFVEGWSRKGNHLLLHDDIAVMPFPLQGVLFVCSILNILIIRVTYNIAPLALIGSPKEFEVYLKERKATFTCVTSEYLAKYSIRSPYLRFVFISMMAANDIKKQPYTLVNAYGQSEGTTVALFDCTEDMAVVPIGTPTDSCKGLVIIDENGNPVKDGEIGELCYENPFARGYVNLPEQTARVFRDGLFHSGDIARINEDGNYVILGRKTDMIKINGNRIEPAEIEAAVKRVLGVDWAFAKGFVQEDRSFICVYYTADITIDYALVREELMKILPNYMIPSYFVHIDDIPHLPNGKVDRQAFQAPDIEQYRTTYTAPTNELEQKICDAMQQVLEIDRVGINDDFFLLGGDSLRTIRLATIIGVSGISVADIYQGRTPQRIADTWMEKQMLE